MILSVSFRFMQSCAVSSRASCNFFSLEEYLQLFFISASVTLRRNPSQQITQLSFTFNPSLLTIPKRKQQVSEILAEAEKYIWRIREEMQCD